MTNASPSDKTAKDKLYRPPVYKPELSWALSGIGLDRHIKYSGKRVRIGHLDSGIDPAATDILSSIERYKVWDYCGKQTTGADMDTVTGHGTRTASLLVGKSRNRLRLGVAPDAKLLSGRVIEGGATIVRLLKGMDWLADESVPIILLCAGLPNRNPIFAPMLAGLRAANILTVCAVGNAGNGKYFSPGSDDCVLSVGAIDRYGQVPDFSGSRRGRFSTQVLAPDILAPGVAVPCATLSGGYSNFSGTSMSAALVAGAAALLLEAVPNASAEDLHNALCFGSTPASAANSKHSRCGYLNVKLALSYLEKHTDKEQPPPPDRLTLEKSGWRDPRLLYKLKHTNSTNLITAVYIVKPDLSTIEWKSSSKGLMKSLFSAAIPDVVEYIPRGRAIVFTAKTANHWLLLNCKQVTYASAADAGRLLSPT